MRQWGLLTPWFPAGTGALASSETGVEDAKAGALPASVPGPAQPQRRLGQHLQCQGRWDSVRVVRGKGSGGNCRSPNGGCAVMRGPWDYFCGWQRDEDSRDGVVVPPSALW